MSSLNPGYFALVMGSGIVSIGMNNHGQVAVSRVLMWLAVVGYVVLVVVTVWRFLAFRTHLHADFTNPARAFGFFTFVAGTDVLGTRFTLAGERGLALALLAVGWVGS